MLAALRAYGPHARAQWASDDMAVGRSLFRTLPEDEFDKQPHIGGGGRLVLVADVRLDNRAELLDRLSIGPRDEAPLADAAILLRAWERWEERTLDHIVGDFAFAIWDRGRRRLLLARDPVGERPLFYSRGGTFFAFSSMPKGLHALPTMARAPNLDRLAEFIGLVPEQGQGSHYAGIDQVRPGHFLTVAGATVASRRYWNPERRQLRLKNAADYRDALREQLDRAVLCRLRGAGSKVASHLSAGWDSSSVTATAARLLAESGGTVYAFTSVPRAGSRAIAPPGRIANEGPLAARTAAMHRNVAHLCVEDAGRSPIAELDRYLELFDRPLYNLCNYTWITEIRRQAAARGNSVLLTGELGNFTVSSAPYTILADLIREGRWGQWWREARLLARNRSVRYRGIAASSFGPWVPDALWRLVRPLSSRPETAAFTALHPRLQAEIDARREAQGIGLASRSKDYFKRTVRALHYYDSGSYRKGALAGWGLDERDPTGDRRLIEFCLSLPIEMLLKDGVRRPLARAALSDRLPPEVLDETRKGYQAPEWHEALTGNLPAVSALLDEIASNGTARTLIDIDALRRLVNDWPREGWDEPETIARYRGALLGALSAGHFILSTSRNEGLAIPSAGKLL